MFIRSLVQSTVVTTYVIYPAQASEVPIVFTQLKVETQYALYVDMLVYAYAA